LTKGGGQWVGLSFKSLRQLSILYSLLFLVVCLLTSCSGKDMKVQQYARYGEELYIKHCSNCHQRDGKGLGLVYPPVDVSDFIDNNLTKTICLIEYGTQGEMTVNGKSYNKPMPGVPTLTDLEIAQIATYLYNSWGRNKGIVEVSRVTKVLQECP
jgi:mono/diheme cytochrome c family protein